MIRAMDRRRPRGKGANLRQGWTFVAAAAAAALVVASCAARTGYTRAETAAMQHAALAYLADSDPTVDRPQPLATWTKVEAGDATRLPRVFQGAPPQVPHSLDGLLPITKDENPCFACHLPNMAGDDDVPIPASHFARAKVMVASRAEAGPGAGAALSYVTGYAQDEDLPGARYNCVQCHTPVAENVTALNPAH